MWGFNIINGVEFFIEEGRELPNFYPESKVPSCFCPHKTIGEAKKWNNGEIGIFWKNGGKNENILQDNVTAQRSEIIYTGMGCLKHVVPLLKLTNYIPLVISDFKVDGVQDRFLLKLQNEVALYGRPVVLVGDDFTPLPHFVKVLK